ncbi:MAG: nucleotide sugar dehydrogenase [Dehalococcoidia bacterium]|nr:MAG: nucleotide sugar dehydrogenase [Dehalococcoidia bacterium]
MTMKEKLLSGEKSIGVWGIGYIGYSSMAYFASKGVKCLGMDIDAGKVEKINKGILPIPNIEYWLGFDTKPLVTSGMMRATTEWQQLISEDIPVHLICIPTEKDELPYDGVLIDVMEKLAAFNKESMKSPPLVIIESTLTPNTTEKTIIPAFEKKGAKVGRDILVGVAPRRDWFISPEKSLKNLPRVVGGTTPETTTLMKEVLGIVCDTILQAKDHRHAELVKSIENAYRHVEITLANQLSLAYPDINMREVLALVGTKWNIGTYHPSFGTGGYCIPLASQYVLAGTNDTDQLSILTSAIQTDRDLPGTVAETVVRKGAEKVGILGLAYKGDLKVHTLSPTLRIVSHLKQKDVAVKVHDPYYTAEEIKQICGAETFRFPDDLGQFDTILIVADHRDYQAIPKNKILSNLKNCKLILDNVGIWGGFDFARAGIEYHLAGTENWLGEQA